MLRPRGSKKAAQFTESVIREMTRLAHQHGAVNLSQGFPDFAAPEEIKEAACAAIRADINQYAVTWGARPLREAIAAQFTARQRRARRRRRAGDRLLRRHRDDDGGAARVGRPRRRGHRLRAVLRELRPGRDRLRRRAALRDAAASRTGRSIPDELAAAFGPRTRAIIINTPNNPTGKVFTRAELTAIARLCQQWDVLAITDEIYEHIVYDGHEHVPMAAIEGMADRTITINGLSKTFSVTGWRIGWAISPPALTGAIRKMHDFLTVGAPAPLQEAGAAALALPRQLLHGARRAIPAAARRDDRDADAPRLPLPRAVRRLLRDDRRRPLRVPRRRGVSRSIWWSRSAWRRCRAAASTARARVAARRSGSASRSATRRWRRRTDGWKSYEVEAVLRCYGATVLRCCSAAVLSAGSWPASAHGT